MFQAKRAEESDTDDLLSSADEANVIIVSLLFVCVMYVTKKLLIFEQMTRFILYLLIVLKNE